MNEVLIGEVLRPHGLHGEVKVYPITRDPGRFTKLKEVILMKGAARLQLTLRSVRVLPDFVYLAFDGVESAEEAEKLRGWQIGIDRSKVPPLQEGWYYFELEGMEVYQRGVCLGTLVQVLATGANDVYVVKGERGEFCVPALKSVVRNVDVAGRRMDVELPPGLLED
ncbi:ribosome maturation factor RimM [Peptococcaceae bacterium CEB3]|nr:ribosome maturation factor RimM [Peptococcaceae bacterium CEB3]